MTTREREGDVAAHRHTGDARRHRPELLEDRVRVLGEQLDRVRGVRLVRPTGTPVVERDHAEALLERGNVPRPGPGGVAQPLDEQDRGAVSRDLGMKRVTVTRSDGVLPGLHALRRCHGRSVEHRG